MKNQTTELQVDALEAVRGGESRDWGKQPFDACVEDGGAQTLGVDGATWCKSADGWVRPPWR